MFQPRSVPSASSDSQPVPLSPAQQRAFEQLLVAVERCGVVAVDGGGLGATTVIRAGEAELGGHALAVRDVVMGIAGRSVFYQAMGALARAVGRHEVVVFEGFDLLASAIEPSLLQLLGRCVAETALARGSALVVYDPESRLDDPTARITIEPFGPDDFAHLFGAMLGKARVERVDFARVHRHALALTCTEIAGACYALREREVTTESILGVLGTEVLASNVVQDEVEDVELADLHGAEDVLAELEAAVLVPLEQHALAEKYGLQPRRGILLCGPPGSGKSTVGRILARRLGGRFFKIDGKTSPADFACVFQSAQRNAPSVVFIDDADVILRESGSALTHYLLSDLDGLHSAGMLRPTVVLTAMTLRGLPAALVRSGRVDVWLQMPLPDATARRQILLDRIAQQPAAFGEVDLNTIARRTRGLTGADLKRVVIDAAHRMAADEARGSREADATPYLLISLGKLRANQRRGAEALAFATDAGPKFQFDEDAPVDVDVDVDEPGEDS